MFLLLILFGLAALGLAFSLYMQMEIPQKPLPPVKPAAVAAQPATVSTAPAAIVITVDSAPADDSVAGSINAGTTVTTDAGSETQKP